jgi:hypothetical protein
MLGLGTRVGRRVVGTAWVALALVTTGSLAACHGSGAGPAPAPTTSAATAGAILTGAPVLTSAPPATTAAAITSLTCAQLSEAPVTTAAVKLPDYPFDSINLTGGRWSAEDGTEILLQSPCGLGDILGDAGLDAVGVVTISTGGTGRFYELVAWRDANGTPVLAATTALGDRNPVLSISIAAGKITVLYLTRTDSAPMAVLDLKRTAIYTVSGTTLLQLSHSDVPYSG